MAQIPGKVLIQPRFLLTFLDINLLQNYIYYSYDKIIDDLEDPRA